MKSKKIAVCVACFCLCALLCSIFATPLQAVGLSAQSAVLMEAQSGAIVYEKDANTRRKMASTTKIMTACVVMDAVKDLQQSVCVDARAVGIEGSSVYLKEKESITIEDLLYALLLSSANDAAAALAYAVSGSIEDFAALMNQKAQEWGLQNTHFTNPHGLDDPDHYTTATELAQITRNALQNETFCKIVATKKHVCPSQDGTMTRVFVNHNRLLRSYDGAVGVKTGFTKKSGRCLVSAAKKDGVTMIAVTLNAPSDWNDHTALLDYGFAQYEHRVLLSEKEVHYDLPVTAGQAQTVTLTNETEFSLTVKKDAGKAELRIEAPQFVFAPIQSGTTMGMAKLYLDGTCVGQVPLVAQTDVRRTECVPRHQKWFGKLMRKDS